MGCQSEDQLEKLANVGLQRCEEEQLKVSDHPLLVHCEVDPINGGR